MEIAAHLSALELIPFALLWLVLVLFLRMRKGKGWIYLLFFTIFYVYLYNVLSYTILQYQSLILAKYFDPNLMLNGVTAGEALNLTPLTTLTSDDVRTSLLNILLMIPFGFGLPFVTNFRMRKVVLTGLLFSIGIELLQLVTGLIAHITFRVADVNDVIFNTLGVAVGYVLFVGFVSLYRRVTRSWRLATHPVLRYIAERPQVDAEPKKKYVLIAALLLIAVAGLVYSMHSRAPHDIQGAGIGAGGVGSQQEDPVTKGSDPCGGTGGAGEIVSKGVSDITIKSRDGGERIITLTPQTNVRDSSGPIPASDLKVGDRVTLVIPGERWVASDVLVCNVPSGN